MSSPGGLVRHRIGAVMWALYRHGEEIPEPDRESVLLTVDLCFNPRQRSGVVCNDQKN